MRSRRSATDISRTSDIFILFSIKLFYIIPTYNEFRGDRELVSRKTHSLFCNRKRNTLCLEKDSSRSDRTYIALRITFTFTHSGIERLLSVRLGREYPDPNLTLTVHIT